MALGLGSGSGLGRRSMSTASLRVHLSTRDPTCGDPVQNHLAGVDCCAPRSNLVPTTDRQFWRNLLCGQRKAWTGTVGFRRLYGSRVRCRARQYLNSGPICDLRCSLLEHVGSRGFDTGSRPSPYSTSSAREPRRVRWASQHAVCLRSTDALPRQASPLRRWVRSRGFDLPGGCAAARSTWFNAARELAWFNRTAGRRVTLLRHWLLRLSCGGDGGVGTGLRSPRPSRPIAVWREVMVDVTHDDDLTFDDHDAVLGTRVVGGPLAAPAQRFDLQRVNTVCELDQSRRAREQLRTEVGQDPERKHVDRELVDILAS